jgi:multicomponent Na+:H+ antiporter subunit C
MTYLPYGAAVWLFLVGLFGVATSRNLIHLTICLTVMQSATYVLLLAVGYRSGGTAPIFTGISLTTKAVDPIVQALTLTDVVVSVVVAALVLALALNVHRRGESADPDELRSMRG